MTGSECDRCEMEVLGLNDIKIPDRMIGDTSLLDSRNRKTVKIARVCNGCLYEAIEETFRWMGWIDM